MLTMPLLLGYTKASWDEVMPEGYGDCRSKADLVARMKELGASPP